MPIKAFTEPESCREAVVTNASRRFVSLIDIDGQRYEAKSRSKALDLVVGDRVIFETIGKHAVVTEVLPAKNSLTRSYREQTRKVAANLDLLLIVCAVGPLFNTYFIDRVLAVASSQFIPVQLVLNKVDLGMSDLADLTNMYTDLGINIIPISAKYSDNISPIQDLLNQACNEIVALCGISGVGKSTLLNTLIPGSTAKTGDVSDYSGQGKQTTTQATAYIYNRQSLPSCLVIDLPGMQSFGAAHLSKEQVAEAFPEILSYRANCAFDNCGHIHEENCGVQAATEQGKIELSRYESYIKMILEIEEAKPY